MKKHRLFLTAFVLLGLLLAGIILIPPVQAAPATFTDDSGSTLMINLEAGEQLTVVSNGTTYTFQTNETFADGGVTDPTNDFGAFGGTSIVLTASGLARYDTINITDSGAGASVTFNDSSGNTYSDSFNITLDDGSSTVTVNNAVSLTSGTLSVAADAIVINAAINVGSEIVTLQPGTAGQLIDLGGADVVGTLGLTDAEIDQITAGTLRIGSSDAGSITFTDTISPAGTSTLSLITGDEIVDGNTVNAADVAVTNLALQTVNGVADSGSDGLLDTDIDTLAALNTTRGGISVLERFSGGDLTIGTVDSVVGAQNTASVDAAPDLGIQIETTDGNLTVNSDVFNQRRNMFIVAQQANGGTGDSLFTNNANIINADSGTSANNAKIDIRANNMTLAVGSTISATNRVILEDDPESNATVAIILGGADGVNTLGLTDAELDTVLTTDVLQIGHSSTGNVDVTAAIDLTDGPDIPTTELNSGAAIDGSGGNVLTANTLNVSAGTSIGLDGDPFAVSATELTTDGSGNQFLSEADSVTIGDADLNADSGNTVELAGGTFLVTSSGGAIANDTSLLSGVTLAGTGTITGTVTAASGATVAPGASPGLINTSSVTLMDGSTFNVEVNGTATAGTDYDQLNVSGSVTINSSANLVTSGTITDAAGAAIVIIDNDAADAVSGTFAGLAEGAALTINGQSFIISYVGGDGNDVVLLESTVPTLTAFTRQNPTTSPTNADSLVFRATFDEEVQNVNTADFTVNSTGSTATVTGVSQVSASEYDVTVSGGDLADFEGTVGLDLSGSQNITDLVGNVLPTAEPDTDETYTLDNTEITVTVNQAAAQDDPTNTASIAFTATFDEAVTDFTASDVTLGGTASGVLSATLSGGPTDYTVTVTGMTGTGTVTAVIEAGAVTDAAGNGNTASTSSDNEVTFDAVAPQADSLTAADITVAGGTTYTFTVAFSDDLAIDTSTLDDSDIRVTGPGGFDQLATLVDVTPTGDGTPRTATYQITAPGGSWDFLDDGTYTVSLQDSEVSDTAGNFVSGGTLGTFAVTLGYTTFLPLIVNSP